MLKIVNKVIEDFKLLETGDRVVAAVSGGPDSVCLLEVLCALAEQYRLSLLVAHLNHGLRGDEALRDRQFVEDLSRGRGLPFVGGHVNIPQLLKTTRISPEELCREERYKFLLEVMTRHGYDKIALGHNSDDQVETVLINLLRGSGLKGLKGYPTMRDGVFIRPLAAVPRRRSQPF